MAANDGYFDSRPALEGALSFVPGIAFLFLAGFCCYSASSAPREISTAPEDNRSAPDAIVRNTYELCREAFIDQELHDFAGGSVVQTMRFGGVIERVG